MTTGSAMNQPTTVEQLQTELNDRKLELKHVNAVCKELQDELTTAKLHARQASDQAGNYGNALQAAKIQIETLKRDLRKAKPDYDFTGLSSLPGDLDMTRFGEAYARLSRQNQKPELWEVISKHIAKVVNNMDSMKLKEAMCAFGSAPNCFELLHEALEHSAADLLHRGEL